MYKKSCEVLIVGGGVVGLSLALGLEKQGITYCVLDDNLSSLMNLGTAVRGLALTKTSLAILRYLGLDLQQILTSPIHQIHVSCEQAWGRMRIEEVQDEFLGLVLNLFELQKQLYDMLPDKNAIIEGRFETYCAKTQVAYVRIHGELCEFQSKVIIAADGMNSSVRQVCGLSAEVAFEQTVVLSLLYFAKPHAGVAHERFTRMGPLALLPWSTHCMAMVWGMNQADADALQQAGSDYLIKKLIEQFGFGLKDIQKCEHLKQHSLQQMFMKKQSYQNILFLGNAAHALHPVAGQGFNLSLRDIVIFLDTVQQFGLGPQMFPMYLVQRSHDQRLTKNITQFLAASMATMTRRFPFVCGAALNILDTFPGARTLLSYYAQGLAYPLPKWIYPYMSAGL